MNIYGRAVAKAWHLLASGDPYLMHVIWVTIKVATLPTAVAAAVGIPLGLTLGVGRFRGRGALLAIANAGLALPPVVVGVAVVAALLPAGPLGSQGLIFTLHGVYLAQAILAFPVLVALTASAVRSLPDGLFEQARAFGANPLQLAGLALREARIGVVAAVIAAVGGGLSEVGAVVLVGGNIEGLDQTLASYALERIDAGDFVTGLAVGIVLIVVIVIVGALFTALQVAGGGRDARVRRAS